MRAINVNDFIFDLDRVKAIVNSDPKTVSLIEKLQYIINEYEKQHSIEAEPARHGKWIPVDGEAPCDEWDCTACGRRMTFMVDMDEDDMAKNYWRCPKCGAKMDLEG